jgi:hypothetical protein
MASKKFDPATLTMLPKDLFSRAIHLEEPNRIFFDYTVFRTFARPDLFADFTAYILALIRQCISSHGEFEMHINLKSFSVTGAQRYHDMIRMFCSECLRTDTEFSKLLTKMYVYNPPKILGAISACFIGFVDDHVRSKIVFK